MQQTICDEIKLRAGHTGAVGIPLKADCSNMDDVQRMFRTVVSEFGPVDILVFVLYNITSEILLFIGMFNSNRLTMQE